MKKLTRLLPGILLGLSILFFGFSVALADTAAGGAAPAGPPPQMLWGLVALVVAQAATFGLKKGSSWYFFHTGPGSVVLSLLSAVLGALPPTIQSKGLDKYALIFACLNAALNFFVTANASNPVAVEAVKARMARKASGAGSGAKQMVVLLALLFVWATLPGCQTPGGQALGKCELNSLPQTLQAVAAAVLSIALNPATTTNDVENAAGGLAPGQFSCVVAAVSAWLHGQTPSHGQADPRLISGAQKLDAYLAQHPASACGDVHRL